MNKWFLLRLKAILLQIDTIKHTKKIQESIRDLGEIFYFDYF